MENKNYNNDFFGWDGVIAPKNYAINIFIVFAIYIILSFVNFHAFEPYVPFKFLLTILVFMSEMIKLVLVMCALSLIYRRIADFAGTKPYKYQLNMRRLFVFIYVIPTLYLLCIRFFFDFMPLFTKFADLLVIFVLLPVAFICSIVFCFIKGI